jgi:hypothetical protein
MNADGMTPAQVQRVALMTNRQAQDRKSSVAAGSCRSCG